MKMTINNKRIKNIVNQEQILKDNNLKKAIIIHNIDKTHQGKEDNLKIDHQRKVLMDTLNKCNNKKIQWKYK